MPFRLRAAAASLCGRGHRENQDAWCLAPAPRAAGLGAVYAVADGVSSVPMGRWAARLACTRVAALAAEGRLRAQADLVQLFAEVDWELREHGNGRAACTLSAAWVHGEVLTLAHVGDSALWRVRGGKVLRLTEPMSSGARLQSWLGMGPSVAEHLQVRQERLRAGDGLLLGTDGLAQVLRPTELAGWWLRVRHHPVRMVGGAIHAVGQRKGNDDATLIAVAVDPLA